jgi:hypothetical protein
MLWNVFGCIGVIVCVILFIIAWRKISNVKSDRRYKKHQEFISAIRKAKSQLLREAVGTLFCVGIRYQHEWPMATESHFELPTFFWEEPCIGLEGISLRARALITLVTYDEETTTDHGQCVRNLASLLAKQARKTPGVTLSIVSELTKQAGGNPLFKEFFTWLPHAKSE